MTGAEAVARALAEAAVPAVCGVPGGGSSLDLLAALKREGIPFLLARHETAAAMMAATLAELTGRPAGVLVTRGPGVSNAANGLAHASLERAPLLLVADGFGRFEAGFATHQRFDQAAMLAPVTRADASAQTMPAGEAARRCLEAALAEPRGPAYLELPGDASRTEATPAAGFSPPTLPAIPEAKLREAAALLHAARRPAIIAGLEATEPAASAATRALAEALGAPVLVTYKAKGVMPDAHPGFGGVFTGGEAEAPLLREADLLILAGADPVEFIAQPWRYAAPILDLARHQRALDYREPSLRLAGDWAAAAASLARQVPARPWPEGSIARHREAWRAALRGPVAGNRGLAPSRIVELAAEACRAAGRKPRVAVDAGAHMFPATSFWPCERPGDLLISNGLASMGYALPAAIAAAWHDPERGALALTGDGGLLMALGELATAAALGLRLTVVVFNDAALSLIGIKTGGRDLPEGALDGPEVDFARVAEGCGARGFRAADEAGFAAAMAEALALPGPALVDARCDPGGYPAMIKALRG
jgi:acetolactate synthase-1/2/3 large subunit